MITECVEVEKAWFHYSGKFFEVAGNEETHF